MDSGSQSEAQPRASQNDERLSRHEAPQVGQNIAPDLIEPNLSLQDDDVPPPSYGAAYGEIDEAQDGLGTRAFLADDGRVNVRIDQKTRGLSSLLVPALRSQLDLLDSNRPHPSPSLPASLTGTASHRPIPPLNVVIHVVGSRGDVQPFVALGKFLKEQFGHRVRLATHPTFQKFVEENGLEFFSIAGDPSELMAFMVKNPGLMPGFDTLRRGDVGKRRREIGNMIERCWRSCIEAGDGMGSDTEFSIDELSRTDTSSIAGNDKSPPFVADAIIANPPSFAHIHCAEKLGIPLHMMFTMPWSPTRAFPHPLANIQATDADTNMTNYLSYALVEMMTWQGLGDVINRFRHNKLGLEPVSATGAPAMLARLRVPWTYCWSPALIPKPVDWRSHISISGFFFLSLASNYTPDSDLAAFLDAGPPPVYIGFGSIVVDDPNAMTKLIFDAVKKTGQRALVSKGWGGFGADEIGIPEGVFMLGNVPHDWLFQRVSCVVHHGGAGTTAAGIACGKPTVVVPFFGDQPFWGSMVARAGAGPRPIPYKQLDAEKLAAAIKEALKPSSVEMAKGLAEKISSEKGTEEGAHFFHQMLEVDKLRCHLCPKRVAVWRIKRTQVRLSAFAAAVLASQGYLNFDDIKLYRPREYDVEDDPIEPITGGASALIGTTTSMTMGIADLPVAALRALKIHPDASKAKSKTPSPSPSRSPFNRESRSQSTSEHARSLSGDSTKQTSSPTSMEDSIRTSSTAANMNISKDSSPPSTPEPGEQQPVPANTVAQQASSTSSPRNKGSIESALESEVSKSKFDMDAAIGTGRGIWRISSAGIKSPMDFTYQLARGFHNAPKLYGEEVRKTEKITDLSSGLKVAGKEFGYGFADGISGLFMEPVRGAKKEGAAGFVKGVGRGIGGIVLKPGAAMWGIPGYTFKGIYKELRKRYGPGVENYVMAARTAQGYDDLAKSTPEERTAVIESWKEIRWYIRKKKMPGEEQLQRMQQAHDEHIARFRSKSIGLGIDPSKIPEFKPLARTDTMLSDDSGVYSPVESTHSAYFPPEKTDEKAAAEKSEYDEDMEEAIRRSVRETSKGDPEQDAMIERAIRVSLAELERSRSKGADDEQLEQAMQASIAHAQQGIIAHEGTAESFSDSGVGSSGMNREEEDLQTALRESKETHEKEVAEKEKAQHEEEVVTNYMLRQSLAESEMKKGVIEE